MSSGDEEVATASELRERLRESDETHRDRYRRAAERYVIAEDAIEALEFREKVAVETGQYVHRLEQERADLWDQRDELEDEVERLRVELHRYAIKADHDLRRCRLCGGRWHRDADPNHGEDCLLHEYEAEGEGS